MSVTLQTDMTRWYFQISAFSYIFNWPLFTLAIFLVPQMEDCVSLFIPLFLLSHHPTLLTYCLILADPLTAAKGGSQRCPLVFGWVCLLSVSLSSVLCATAVPFSPGGLSGGGSGWNSSSLDISNFRVPVGLMAATPGPLFPGHTGNQCGWEIPDSKGRMKIQQLLHEATSRRELDRLGTHARVCVCVCVQKLEIT